MRHGQPRSPLRPAVCLAAALAGAIGGAGCIDVPDFADPQRIDRPRALAVIAEPPEIAPGEATRLSILLAGSDEHVVRWSACGLFDSNIGGMQYGEEPSREGCAGGDFSLPLGEGDEVELPGAASAALFENLELAADILGALFPVETIERVRTEVGLPLLVEAAVETEDGLERAVKRVLISENPTPHNNPPPPHFRFGEVEVAADADQPMRCAPVDGSTARYRPGQEIELAPVVEGDEEPWVETYRVIDARGVLSERREKAFYSWFATGGALSEGITEAPLRNEIWSAPAEPGAHTLFVVVRDGHGGTSACALLVEGE